MSKGEIYLAFNEKTGKFEALKKIEIFTTENDPDPEDMETIIVSKGCLKARKGRFVVYDVEYLKKHIEQEAAIYGNVSAIEAIGNGKPLPKGHEREVYNMGYKDGVEAYKVMMEIEKEEA